MHDPNKDIEQREFAAAQAENKALAEYESVEAVGDSEFAWPASPEEREWDFMERAEDRGLYDETGQVY